MKQITKIMVAWELAEEGIPRLHIAKRLEIGRATLYRWLDGIAEAGSIHGFLDIYKCQERRTSKAKN